jgi:uroporphyrinogen decarboxylase
MTAIQDRMTSRQRFKETMTCGAPDRVPYFEEGIRPDVLRAWRKQGMPKHCNINEMFASDLRVELEPELEPYPELKTLPRDAADLAELQRRLDPADSRRLPRGWKRMIRNLKKTDTVRMLRIHRGLFLSMGVRGWDRFYDLMLLLAQSPDMAREGMQIRGRFCADLAERIMQEIDIDAAIFSEPIGGNQGPLVSPAMYTDVVLKSYQPVIDVFHKYGVETIIFRTYANARILIPVILKWGFNCLWACEVNIDAMDYRSLRSEFGSDLRLIGGIDLDALRYGKDAIDCELKEKLPLLLEQGGYVPLADGRVREDIPYENYVYYRHVLEKVTQP